ncbi:hypothetical protein BANRA_05041 [Pseudomonas aeruginosa]|nr:hypothetical protein A7R81_17655 [Pseudomonas aeruginosa]VCY59391.1 hypothetical protein BANRA_05041 [Pseudomonas aeruginosa]
MHAETLAFDFTNGQADTINANKAFMKYVLHNFFVWHAKPKLVVIIRQLNLFYLRYADNMSRHKMTANLITELGGPLNIYEVAHN